MDLPELMSKTVTRLVCAKCGTPMTGYAEEGPEAECSDCAFGFGPAMDRAARAVEQAHFERTGERRECGSLLREALGIE